ncbi:MAG: hypothetical protein P8171_22530 [Candidatus Thiodiazotropha sp.]
MHVEQLQHLAFRDTVGGVGEDVHDRHTAHRDHHFEGAGVEKVSYQHAGLVAPHCVGGLPVAAQVGAVHHIVVQQGGGVDELDDGGQVDVPLRGVTAGPGGQQHDHGPQAFAPAVYDVGADLIDQHHIRFELLDDQAVYRLHVIGNEVSNPGDIHG